MNGSFVELEVVTAGGLRFSKLFPELPINLGRAPNADWYLADDAISSRHARIDLIDNELVLADNGSQSGVFVSSPRRQRIDRPVRLSDVGNTFSIGSYTVRVRRLDNGARLADIERINDVALSSTGGSSLTVKHTAEVSHG